MRSRSRAHLPCGRSRAGRRFLPRNWNGRRIPDRKARFEFVMPSLSADPKVREQSFERLRDVKNRRREPWVLESLGYLHHPLRARRPSISFGQAWTCCRKSSVRATSFSRSAGSMRRSEATGLPEAARMVRQFLDQSPKLPERLRWVVLTSADELFRAS